MRWYWRSGGSGCGPGCEITEISYGSQTHRRFGGGGVGKGRDHYVGVTWADNASRTEVLFRVDKGEYREFLASLERMTGKKAVDTSQVADGGALLAVRF